MPVLIQFNRGTEAGIPTLSAGEPAFTTDTYKLFVGDGTTNHEIAGGLVIGTDVQAWAATLDTLAAVTPVADGTYTVGARLTPGGTDGTITTVGGLITAITEAT